MTSLRGLAPIRGPRCDRLILGSFPGVASLERREYYGFPRNRFWPLMERLLGIPADAAYATRTRGLVSEGIALWDVLAACDREGSRDDRIDPASVVPNDLVGFLGRHRAIGAVLLNGGTAQRLFHRWILPSLGERATALRVVALPSTSPLNARMDLRRLERAWRHGLVRLR